MDVASHALTGLPVFWGQAPSPSAATALLALRRWCASLSLSSPETIPRPYGLWALLGGLGALLLLAIAFQGPKRALGQLLDVPGHVRLISTALARLRRAGRLVAVACGVTVVVWTANQSGSYNNPQGLDDFDVLLKTKGLGEVALEQGVLAGLTPLRDVLGLGDTLPLLVVAAALVFRLSADRWGGIISPVAEAQTSTSGWTTVCWGGAWLYALYRFAAMIDTGDLPLGGCLFVEAGVVPALMILADGLLLAWILVELRNAGLGDGGEPLDLNGTLVLLPASALACFLAMPARSVGTGVLLSFLHIPRFENGVSVVTYQRLAWGLVGLQGLGLLASGLPGAVAWSRGTLRGALRGYARLLAAEGGRLTALMGLSALAAGGLSAAAYAAVLPMPRETWLLAAADSYAHYATLPIGLATLSAMIELGERSLPQARLAEAARLAVAMPSGT